MTYIDPKASVLPTTPQPHEDQEQMKEPETKRQLRQIIGFFSIFREYLPGFAMICKPLIDLTGKPTPERIPFNSRERESFNMLKRMLCDAASKHH